MSREPLQKALDALDLAQSLLERSMHYDQILNAYTALRDELAKPTLPMSPEYLPQYIATNNIKPTTEGGGGAGGKEWIGLSINEGRDFFESKLTRAELIAEISEFLEEKNNAV